MHVRVFVNVFIERTEQGRRKDLSKMELMMKKEIQQELVDWVGAPLQIGLRNTRDKLVANLNPV